MAAEGTGGSELTQLVADHVLLDIDGHVLAAIMDGANLVVSEVFATPGPILKRMMPRAQGRAYRINKRTSHVTLAVTEKA